MAIYHLSGKIISRSQGRSSVAASAYRAAEKLVDERTGLTHDFTKKADDVFHREILLPCDAPAWMSDRAKLWSHTEAVEKRKDAQLAREFNIALPKELTDKQNIALAREFINKQFVDRGMVADLCLHHGIHKGEKQPHIHVMLSLREVSAEGFGKKARLWNRKDLLLAYREAWAQHCNHHLALHGHDLRIDHRTLEAQGINLEPQTKLGPRQHRRIWINWPSTKPLLAPMASGYWLSLRLPLMRLRSNNQPSPYVTLRALRIVTVWMRVSLSGYF